MRRTNEVGCDILLPIDAVVATELSAGVETRTVPVDEVGSDDMILAVGHATVLLLEERLKAAYTVCWNGPPGASEIPSFDGRTVAVAHAVAKLTDAGAVRGGDTVPALTTPALRRLSYVSAAGAAFLEWREGRRCRASAHCAREQMATLSVDLNVHERGPFQ